MSHGFAYAQARAQARLGDLLPDPAWQHLDGARTLSGFLEEARRTSLTHWVSGLSQTSDTHHVEHELERHLLGLTAEARRWVPRPWQPAVDWTRWLLLLPMLRRLLAGGEPPAWAAGVPLVGPILATAADDLPAALRAAGAGPLLRAAGESSLEDLWLTHWRALWPSGPRAHRRGVQRLVDTLVAHRSRFRNLSPQEAWPERRRLRERLRQLFRRHPLQPAAVFAWLALEALELEVLRAALTTRSAFGTLGVA
jgi:hypothetical protein